MTITIVAGTGTDTAVGTAVGAGTDVGAGLGVDVGLGLGLAALAEPTVMPNVATTVAAANNELAMRRTERIEVFIRLIPCIQLVMQVRAVSTCNTLSVTGIAYALIAKVLRRDVRDLPVTFRVRVSRINVRRTYALILNRRVERWSSS